jgi:hypothetical protein
LPEEILDLKLEIKWEYDFGDGIFLGNNPLKTLP